MGVTVRRQQRDGAWYVHVVHRGERAAQKCKDQAEAEAFAAALRGAILLGTFDIAELRARSEPATPSPTVEDFYRTIRPLWEGSLASKTFTKYDGDFRNHILPDLGATPLDKLTRDRVKDFVVTLRQKPARKRAATEARRAKEPERKLARDSVRNVIAALRAALNEAVERGLLRENPALRLGKLYKEAGQIHDEVDPFTAEEVKRLLAATLEHFGRANYVVMLTALHTGLRSGEIAGLEWSDVDFANRLLIVRGQWQDGRRVRTKTRKRRQVDISDVLLAELQALKKRRQEEYLKRGKSEIPAPVFLSPGLIIWDDGKPVGRCEGKPLDMDNWRNRVYWKACDRAGVRRRRLHDTRHTFASILLMNGESPAYVRDQMGHSSIKVTVDVYGHFIPGANRAAVNKLPSLGALKAKTTTAGE